MSKCRNALGLAILLVCWPAIAQAQNATTVGTLTLTATFDIIGVKATYTGDANSNNTGAVQFRVTGSSTWHDAYSPVPDRRATRTSDGTGNSNTANQNQFRTAIFLFVPNTSYDVQVTYSDADGVTGGPTLSSTVSTMAVSPPTGGTDRYVDCSLGVNGSGTSGSPWNVLSSANTNMVAGDVLHVRPSTCAPITWTKAGNAGAWVVIVGDVRDSCFISGGAGVTSNLIVNANFVQIKNLRLKQTNHNGFQLSSGKNHIWLENNYIEDTSIAKAYNDAGILLDGNNNDVYILANTILTSTAGPTGGTNAETTGIYFNGATNATGHVVIKANTITGPYRDGIGNTPEDTTFNGLNDSDILFNTIGAQIDDPIQMEGGDLNLRVVGNVMNASAGPTCEAHQTGYFGPIFSLRNVCYTSSTNGSQAYKVGGMQFAFVFHNSVSANGASGNECFGDSGGGSLSYITAENNIFKCNTNALVNLSATGTTLDYNQYYRTSGAGNYVKNWNGASNYTSIAAFTAANPTQEVHGQQGDPLFTDNALHIDNTSPAYNKGVALANINDATSHWPAAGTAPDMGAYEVGTAPANFVAQISCASVSGVTVAGSTNPATDGATLVVTGCNFGATTGTLQVCEAATFATSVNCQTQTTSAWTATKVTATLAKGSLGDGAAYLYVTPNAGSPNTTGLPVQLHYMVY